MLIAIACVLGYLVIAAITYGFTKALGSGSPEMDALFWPVLLMMVPVYGTVLALVWLAELLRVHTWHQPFTDLGGLLAEPFKRKDAT